jgi:glycosyltransferase involved in cell wall biosynthesis
MKILTALTYYRPHISGLTIYAERVCRALAQRGHQVTVLTSQYERSLPPREKQDGVEIFRVPVAWRISKGVIMPTIGWHATRLALQHDVIHLHLPQFDAAGIALRGRLFHHPVVLTYHSDLTLPPSLFHWLVERVVHLGNHAAVRLGDVVVTNTLDFAQNSPFLRRYPAKVQAILPPVEIPLPTPRSIEAFRNKFSIRQVGPLIGMVARLSAEKGIEYLLQALPAILERFPGASILHIGPREPVGEYAYAQRLAPLLERCGEQYRIVWHGAGRGRPVRHPLCRHRSARRAHGHPPDRYGAERTAAGCRRAGRGRLRSYRQPQPLRMLPGRCGPEILAGGDCGAV